MPLPAPAELLPHSGPMLLLERVLACSTTEACAELVVTDDSPFFDAGLGGVPAWVGIEYMAQTVALCGGWRQHQRGLPVKIGLLLGSRCYRSNTGVFGLGSRLRITIAELFSDDEGGLGAFDCRIDGQATDGTAIEASAQLKVFRPQHPEAYIRQR